MLIFSGRIVMVNILETVCNPMVHIKEKLLLIHSFLPKKGDKNATGLAVLAIVALVQEQ